MIDWTLYFVVKMSGSSSRSSGGSRSASVKGILKKGKETFHDAKE